MNLLLPAMAQILWTFVVFGILFRTRRAAIQARAVRLRDVAVSGETWPEPARLAANNLANQFETPVLFYALIAIAIQAGATGWIMTSLAWAYVATRVVHTMIHTGSNAIKWRAGAFAVGVAILMAMWIGTLVVIL
jgi:hypothetical protein